NCCDPYLNHAVLLARFKSRLHLGMAGVDARRATPPDPILPAFTEARRVRKPRPEPASIGTSSPATERASGSEKFEVLLFSRHDACVRRGRARSQDHCTKELVQNPLYLILIKCTVENAREIGVPGRPGESSRPSRLTRFSCLAALQWPVVLT